MTAASFMRNFGKIERLSVIELMELKEVLIDDMDQLTQSAPPKAAPRSGYRYPMGDFYIIMAVSRTVARLTILCPVRTSPTVFAYLLALSENGDSCR